MARRRGWLKSWPLYVTVMVLAGALVAGYMAFYSPVATVILVRHAEKSATPPDNPVLSDLGQKRAQALARTLAGRNVKALYATEFARTQQTLQPLSAQLGIPVQQIGAGDADALVRDILTNHRGDTVVVAGHSNTVPVVIEKLRGGAVPPIADTEYDKMFVVTVYRFGKSKVVQSRYDVAG